METGAVGGGWENSAEVVVVGAGPAGSSVAFALARAGVDVLVLDRARFPRPKPCAEFLSPQASRILNDMGALEQVERSGAALLDGMIIRAPNGRRIVGEFGSCPLFRAYRTQALSVRRETLDAILVDRARSAGARVVEGVHVVDLERDGDGRVVGVRVRESAASRGAAGGAVVRARLVIGADGLRSVVARRLALARALRWPKRIALVTHYRDVDGIGPCGEMHVERDGYVGIADVGGGITTIGLVVPASRAHEIGGDSGGEEGRADFVQRWLASHSQLASRFANAERVSAVRATGPFAARCLRAWAPGAALVGDAADFFDPFTGEGIYAALRGGEMLAGVAYQALDSRGPRESDAALASYDRMRRKEFGGKWWVERWIAAVVASPSLMNRAARVLTARKDMADLLVGVFGDFVPPRAVLNARYLLTLFCLPGRFLPTVPALPLDG
jgi:menaquinone-9 beta-reductase